MATTTSAVPERHAGARGPWLRAAVLGADDGIVSSASLMLGVLAASGSQAAVLTAGVAGLVAGSGSMAAGEYVSVGSQRDAEQADLARERGELAADPLAERHELAEMYVQRGLPPELAAQVAEHLSEVDALGAHAREELGLTKDRVSRPLQAAVVSAGSFAVGALIPVLAVVAAPMSVRGVAVVASALMALVVLGATGARLGGAPPLPAMLRVGLGGAAAMAATALIGKLLGGVAL